MQTLVVFTKPEGTTLHLLPDGAGDEYEGCHGCILNYNDHEKGGDAADRTEHLAYMLGAVKWYDNGPVPTLTEFLERIKGQESASTESSGEPAPWANAELKVNVIHPNGPLRIINCGWSR